MIQIIDLLIPLNWRSDHLGCSFVLSWDWPEVMHARTHQEDHRHSVWTTAPVLLRRKEKHPRPPWFGGELFSFETVQCSGKTGFAVYHLRLAGWIRSGLYVCANVLHTSGGAVKWLYQWKTECAFSLEERGVGSLCYCGADSPCSQGVAS